MMMTIKEIATIAGVSASTVSRIINSPDGSFATKEVRDRVWKVIREYHYVPNQNAKSLKQKNSPQKAKHRSIVCVLGRAKSVSENPFFEQIIRAVEQHSLGLEIIVSKILSYDNKPLFSGDYGKSGGAIIIGRIQDTQIKAIEEQYKYIVYVGRNQLGANFDQVICDGREATEKAVSFLIENGHKRIAYFGETTNEVRFQSYTETLERHAIRPDDAYIINIPHTAEGGYSASEELLKSAPVLPTAVFCATDTVAIAAMRRFREKRIKIPEHLSIIGMDNIELSAYVSPMLATVEMPAVEMGNIAVNILLDRINKGHSLPMKIIMPSKLIKRESVGKVNEK